MDVLNRKEIAAGVFLSTLSDGRFKKNRITFGFLTQMTKESLATNSVVTKVLTNSCRILPDMRALNARLAELYGATMHTAMANKGDTQCFSIDITVIDDRYALEGEKLLEEAVKLLLDCIFDPITENDGFVPAITETEKQVVIDTTEAELNDKRMYTFRRAVEYLCAGEPFAERVLVEEVKKVTPQSAFSAYKNLLETARIEIFCEGCNDFAAARESLTAAFANAKRGTMDDCHSKLSPPKAETATHTETLDVNQSKMVLGFKTQSPDEAAHSIMTKIYGGTATSKLFENVREKMSLCYYCFASLFDLKGVMLAECGVEQANIEKARNEIENQLDLIRKGEFNDTEIHHAKMAMENQLKSLGDKLSGLSSWYLSRIYRCDVLTPEQMLERVNAVTRERIIEAAKSMKLDTVYVLSGNGETEEAV
jgi:predicted Zn-dependent peptidase